MNYPRPDWQTYFMRMADLVSTRSTCKRRKVGAVITLENRVLSTGYNGSPSGLRECLEIGCLREKLNIPSGERSELCRGTHAEQNAILQCAKFGITVDGSAIYVATSPCAHCAKSIIAVGIRQIFFKEFYNDSLAIELLNESGVKMDQVEYVP
jgi:dCMP deaminase